jgi:hypothetical protein
MMFVSQKGGMYPIGFEGVVYPAIISKLNLRLYSETGRGIVINEENMVNNCFRFVMFAFYLYVGMLQQPSYSKVCR